MIISFKGKDKEVIELHSSIGYTESSSGTKYYYVKCPVTGEWMFRNPKAWEGLLKKHRNNLDDIANFTISNAGKHIQNGTTKKEKVDVTTTTTTAEPKVKGKVKFEKAGDGVCRLEQTGYNDQYRKVSWTAKVSV